MPGYVIALSVVAAAIPVMIYIMFVWWMDRYEREPFWLVGLTFLYGASGAAAIAIFGSQPVADVLGIGEFGGQAIIVAPLVEEPAKGLVLFVLLLSRHFDNTTDGVVYGAATGLGFAMTENFIYFLAFYNIGGDELWVDTVIKRALFSAVMHSCASASFGALLGVCRYRGAVKQWLAAPLLGLAVAMLIHGTFNGLLVHAGEARSEALGWAAMAIAPVLAVVLLIITQVVLRGEHRMLQRELELEAESGLIPADHAAILPYWRRRSGGAWLDPGVDRKRYIRAATLLAFRRHQRHHGNPPATLDRDIERLRDEIGALLDRGRSGP